MKANLASLAINLSLFYAFSDLLGQEIFLLGACIISLAHLAIAIKGKKIKVKQI